MRTIPPTISGKRIFSKQMGQVKIELKAMQENILKVAAVKTLGRLASRSPIRTGRYITNHKVNQTGQSSYDLRYTTTQWTAEGGGEGYGGYQKDRRSAVGFMMANGQRAIGMLKNPEKITISNTVSYAKNVEYGWHFERGAAPGYFVYHHTANDMLEEIPKIIKEEEAKAQAKINGI